MRVLKGFAGRSSAVLPLAVLCTSAAGIQIAQAQDIALEEIVVTAERRSEDLQRTAASVSVRNGEDLLNEGKYSLRDILEDVPGVFGGAATTALGSSGGGGTDTMSAGLTIRGIPSSTGSAGTITSTAAAAAIYVDGVYEGVGGSYDLERIEVLRGPQGTLYGRSATSGVVAIHTRNPELGEFGGDVTLETGNFSLEHYSGALNLPLGTDTLALRLAGNFYEREGYDNGSAGLHRTADAKAKLLFQPSDALSVLVGFALQDNFERSGGRAIAASSDPDTVAYQSAPVGDGDNRFRQAWVEVNWDIGFATLTYQPAWRSWRQDANEVVSAGALGLLLQKKYTPKDDFWTHELRLSSNPDSKLIWQAGALYYDNKLENFNAVTLPQSPIPGLGFSADSEKHTTAAGIFTEATYPFSDAWRATAGVRFDHTKVVSLQDYTSNAVTKSIPPEQQENSFDNITYKIRAEHDLTPSNLIYASISTGFSPGDVSVTSCPDASTVDPTDTTPCVIVLDAESVTAYEIGSKNRFLGDTLQVNAAVYYNDYSGYQTAGIDTDPTSQIAITPFSVPVQAYGLEMDLLWQLTGVDRIGFDVAYTSSRFTDKPTLFAQYVALDEVPGIVPLVANLSYEHIFQLPGGSELSLRADGRYLSERYAPNNDNVSAQQVTAGAKPYFRMNADVIGNLSATWSSPEKRLSVTGYVRNIGDNRYFTTMSVDLADVVGNTLPRDQWQFTQSLYDPRTYGALVRVKF